MIRFIVVMLIAMIGLTSALTVDRYRLKMNAQAQVIASQQAVIADAAADLKAEREFGESRESVIKAMFKIGEDMEEIRTTLRTQDQANRKVLQELIKNDKQVRDYMVLTIPSALGLQYARPETTDPTRYGPENNEPGGKVQPGSVQNAGKGSTKK